MNESNNIALSRRNFLRGGLVAGAGLMLQRSPVEATARSADTINVAIIGTGAQGRVLLESAVNIPDVRFKAVCDIWDYSRRYGQGILRKSGQLVNAYVDFREMLETEKDLDAVIVATPDCWHAEHTVECLRRGLHVYCEKLMSHDLAEARSMMETARQTGKLLQIGHQRRSNPRYLQARDALLREANILGRVTNINGQWNRAVTEPLGWPEKFAIEPAILEKYGYGNMHRFRNWRWFKEYGGGPVSDLGGHQIDVFNWFLGAYPVGLTADGGTDYYENLEWYDNVMAIFEYPGPEGAVRAFYQVLTTTSAGGGYFECFMGTEGALKMSENPKYTKLFREARAREWDAFAEKGLIRRGGGGATNAAEGKSAAMIDVRETASLSAWKPTAELNKPIHQPHLENFFAAIRGKAELNCPGEVGYASAVTTLMVNKAVAAGCKLRLEPDQFTV